MVQPSITPDLQGLLDEGPVAREVGDIIHRPDADLPVAMMVNERTGPQKYDVYNTLTGMKTTVDRNRIIVVLNKRREDGKLAFSRQPVTPEQIPGTLICPLHKDAPTRELADQFHLGPCVKSNLVNPMEVQYHFERTHPRSFRAFKEHEEKQQREEDRALQHQMIERLSNIVPQQVVPIDTGPLPLPSDEYIKEQFEEVPLVPPGEAVYVAKRNRHYTRTCQTCKLIFEGSKAAIAQRKLDKHKVKVHGG